MKKLIITLSIILIAIVQLSAQNFQGIATYQTKMNFEFDKKKDSTKTDKNNMMNDEMRKSIREMIRKQSEKTYTLVFDKTSSIYTQDKELEKPTPASSGFSITIDTGSADVLYKNTKEKTFTKATESFGKEFLIIDTLETIDWKLGKESKKIGKYLCFKATAIKLIDDFDYKTMEKKDTQKELKYTAWYTPEIPINNGPAEISGLPGLVLELHQDKMHFVCTKLVLNPKEKVEIKAPKKGKKITAKKFEDMMLEKSKEMMKQFKGGRKKGKGNSNTIFIGG
ncbi:MAG: GLPGLI family protein [Flavobacteriaceae bacterium]